MICFDDLKFEISYYLPKKQRKIWKEKNKYANIRLICKHLAEWF